MNKLLLTIKLRWKTLLALALAFTAFKFNLMFIWGLFCLFWAIENIRIKEAYFVERIERRENPILYWIIVGIWVTTGIFYFSMDPTIWHILAKI